MDFLLEMTPGAGWLARENDRVVFLPDAESVDVAHDVIEPLLVPRGTGAAFDTLASWMESSRPLPPTLLLGMDRQVQVMAHAVSELRITDAGTREPSPLALGSQRGPMALPGVSSVAFVTAGAEPSGMLVEGVIRAGGFVVHVHSNASARTSEEVLADPAPATMQLHLDEYSVEVGDGMVLGRWPYKHAAFNAQLEPLILADPAVSRLHAEIIPEGNTAVVVDKSSHNGTWVVKAGSEERVRLAPETPHALGEGDRIVLGDTVVQFGGSPER